MTGTVTFLDGDIVLGKGRTAQESGGTLTHPADISVAEGALSTEQAEVVFGEWLKGDKGDTPVITAAKSGQTTRLMADGEFVADIQDLGTVIVAENHRIRLTLQSGAGASGHKITL